MHPRVQWAVARARSAVLLARAWDESQHPREPAGSSSGGEFTSSGGNGGGDSKPAGGKKKAEVADFTKDGVFLDSNTMNNPDAQKKFLETWEKNVGEAPAAFKKEFLGGMPGSMNIRFHDNLDAITVTGALHDADGNSIGDYTRDIDLDDHRAASSYFKLHSGQTGKNVGKKLLAANVEMYKKMGVERVSVHANIDVGGYAWAKYGYVPKSSDWSDLSKEIDDKIDRMSSGGSGGGFRASSWEELSEHQQDQIEREFINITHDEFLDSEVDNWRESGQPLEQAKLDLVEQFNASVQQWGETAIDGYRKQRADAGKAPIPYDNFTLLNAISLDYDDRSGDGSGDLTVEFDDDELQKPEGVQSDQPTLPGIEEVKPHERLTEEMRDGIERALNKSFDNEASEKADDVTVPEYLADNIREFQSEVWSGYSERDKYKWAERNASEMLGSDEDGDFEGSGEISDDDAERLRRLTSSSDPKAVWAIADSTWGKDLLLGTDWNGVLDLKDRETMDRFNAYVGKK
jgi:hypothetical protein